MSEAKPLIVQVTNISHNVSEDQIKHFLEYIGRVREIRMYPEGDFNEPSMTKVAYARFDHADHVEVALHLTNTVMVDRALILLPYPDDNIPDETRALRVAAPVSTVAGMLPPTKEWPSHVANMVCGQGSNQTILTIDAKLQELGLQQYPPLPAKTDLSRVEEIRRTIYVSNLEPAVNAEQLVQFFSQAGEVMFARMAGDENLPSRNAYIEFTNQRSVPTALAYNGVSINGRPIKVTHSLNAVTNKPQTKAQEQLTKDINDVMKSNKDLERLISDAARGGSKVSSSKKERSRSRSKEHRRHKSKEPRSRERRRSPSPRKSSKRPSRPKPQKQEEKTPSSSNKERRKRSRSKSKDRRRSRSRDRKRSRSSGRKRDRSRDRRRRSRSKDKKRSRSRDRKPSRRSSSRDRSRRSTKDDKPRKEAESKEPKDVKVVRDYDAEEKDMESLLANKSENGHNVELENKNEDTRDSTLNGEKSENGDESRASDSPSEYEKSGLNNDENSMGLYNDENSMDPMAQLEESLTTDSKNMCESTQDSADMDTCGDDD